jgi:hypothetical protein
MEAWRRPNVSEVCCGILAASKEQKDALLHRDVFGRGISAGETFDDWSSYVAIIPINDPLVELLRKLAGLRPCLASTWRRHAEEGSVLPRILDVLAKRDLGALNQLLDNAIRQDWDSLCFDHATFGNHHSYAQRIRIWCDRARVSANVSWEDGYALFAPLVRPT